MIVNAIIEMGESGSMSLGQRITDLRKSRGLSQAMLAKQLGVSQPAVANYERDARDPPASFLGAICREYSVNPAWLLDRRGAMYEQDIEALHSKALEVSWAYLSANDAEVKVEHLIKLSGALFHYLMKHNELDDSMIDAMGKLVA